MNTATSVLRNDHEAILRMLDATEEVARQLQKGVSVAPDTLTDLQEFFQIFADRCHHGKEEDLLFPFLESRGIPRNGGPIGMMLQEHDMGRRFIGQMVAASGEYAAGTKGAGERWSVAAREYSSVLRAHIDKENNILFVMAERILSDSDQAKLAEAFEKIEIAKVGPGTHARLHASMERLTAAILS